MTVFNLIGYFLIALFMFVVYGCGDEPSKANNVSKAESASRTLPVQATKIVTLDQQMMSNITVQELHEKSIPLLLTTTGKVQFNEDQMARILAPVSGHVQQLHIKVGDTVQAETTLFFIHSREIATVIDEHFESRKDLDLAEKTYVMTQDLFAHQAASRMALQQAESELAKAKARVTRTAESLRALGVDVRENDMKGEMSARVPVRTPRSGTVIERLVTEGQFVQTDNTTLVTIADLSTLWVLADIFERDLHLVEAGQKAEVTTAAYPEQRFVAHVVRVSDIVDPSTRTVKVRFLVANPDGRLKPEMFASVSLFLHESKPALTIPPQAVFTESGRSFVYVRTGERAFTRRAVETEPNDGDLKVLSGIQEGEQVVSDGALMLRLQEDRQELN
jgi:cobalt-zinc-cadmium efflux system membrane fusion protein